MLSGQGHCITLVLCYFRSWERSVFKDYTEVILEKSGSTGVLQLKSEMKLILLEKSFSAALPIFSQFSPR